MSGIVFFVKILKVLVRMNKLFLEREIEKMYWVVVKNLFFLEKEKFIYYLKRNLK